MRKARTRPKSATKATILYGEDVVVPGKRVNKVARPLKSSSEAWSAQNAEYQSMVRALTLTAREQMQQDAEMNDSTDYFDSGRHGDSDNDDLDPTLLTIPHGEEGMMNSYAGGEFEYYNLLSSTLQHSQQREDDRTRRDRVEIQNALWDRQLPALVDAYLVFKAKGPPTNTDNAETWSINTMDFQSTAHRTFFHPSKSQSINESLAQHGYIGGSAEKPTIAFSFSLFEIYRQIHRVCPKFSIDGLARALQYIHKMTRASHLEDQLRNAWDAYLSILRGVDGLALMALGRTDERVYDEILCAPCMYRLEDEPTLVPSMLACIDGNGSLKLFDASLRAGKQRVDSRELKNHRWIEKVQVNKFADEVQNAAKKSRKKSTTTVDTFGPNTDFHESDIPFLSAHESHELHSTVDVCVERWKNAGPESRKQMFALFAITGIFLATCRHGHVLVLCDMVRSGELMKYPLAIIDNLIDRFGKELGIGYDIMCAFYKTLLRSAKLRDKVLGNHLIGVVPAFHGHAHNRKCQVDWHPQYINGVGLEDFEECERTFSLSNHLASTTRLTTEFHRRQAIQEHFQFYDEDKHAMSGNFIYQNYRQALDRLAKDLPLLEEMCMQRRITRHDCEGFLASEREHFNMNFEDPPELTKKLNYAELLQKLWAAQVQSDNARAKFNSLQTAEGKALGDKEKARIETRNRTTLKAYQLVEEEIADYEVEHGIVKRWHEGSRRYNEALKELAHREYRRALEKLERLVVQRLFELTKLNRSELGYNERTKISDALKSRSGAIRTALNEFNQVAKKVGRTPLDFDEILKMVTVADFDLLKNSHIDLSALAWTKPENRTMMQLHFGVKRAEEEIQRLNVEIRRLITFMIDDHADFRRAIDVCGDDDTLGAELTQQLRYRLVVNERIAERLLQTSKLHGFTGTLLPGQRINRKESITDSVPLPEWATSVLGLQRSAEDSIQIGISPDMVPDRLGEEDGQSTLEANGQSYEEDVLNFMEQLALEEDEGDGDRDSLSGLQ